MKGQMLQIITIIGIAVLLLFVAFQGQLIEINAPDLPRYTAGFTLLDSKPLTDQFTGGSINTIPENPDTPTGKNCWGSGCSWRGTCEADRCIVRVEGGRSSDSKPYDLAWVYDKGDAMLLSYSFQTSPDFIGDWKIVRDNYEIDKVTCYENPTEWSSCIDGKQSRYVPELVGNVCNVSMEERVCNPPIDLTPNDTIDTIRPIQPTPPVVDRLRDFFQWVSDSISKFISQFRQ